MNYVHSEHVVSEHFNYENFMKAVLEIENFLHVNVKNCRHFCKFVEDWSWKIQHLTSLYCVLRCLSNSNLLCRFVEPNQLCSWLQGQSYPQLKNDEWTQYLMSLMDIMKHLQAINLEQQSIRKVISDLTQTILNFQNHIRIFQRDIFSKTLSFSQCQKETESFFWRGYCKPQNGRIQK